MAKKTTQKTETNAGGLPLVKPNKIIQQLLKVEFSTDQIKEFGAQLARTTTEMAELENQKKASASNYKASLDNKKALAESLSNKISNGFDYDNIDCEVFLNMPNTGKKTIERKDTKETVEVLDMTVDELQVEMDFKKVEN